MTINLVNPPRSTVSSEKLEYDIYFPITNVIPKITEINFNGRIYCRGPPEPRKYFKVFLLTIKNKDLNYNLYFF